jgi:hypothetical protein
MDVFGMNAFLRLRIDLPQNCDGRVCCPEVDSYLELSVSPIALSFIFDVHHVSVQTLRLT